MSVSTHRQLHPQLHDMTRSENAKSENSIPEFSLLQDVFRLLIRVLSGAMGALLHSFEATASLRVLDYGSCPAIEECQWSASGHPASGHRRKMSKSHQSAISFGEKH
jgi:hypothetical protein